MKFILFFSFLLSLCHGVVWVGVGLLLRNHLEAVLSMILRKPIPDELIRPEDYQAAKSTIDTIGLILILIGIITMFIGLSSFMAGWNIPSENINFKY